MPPANGLPVDYDIAYLRAPRFADTQNSVWPDTVRPLLPDGGALTVLSSTRFTFAVPVAAAGGPASVHVFNPPFIAATSSGNDPDGAFTVVAP